MSNKTYQASLRFLICIFFLITSASAFADVSVWQGPYIGTFLGGSFGNNHITTDTGVVMSTSYLTTATDINAVNSAGTSRNNPNSLMGGFEAGHDWTWKQIAYGMIVDYNKFSLSSSDHINSVSYPSSSDRYSVYTSMSTNWLFTFRARLGYQAMVHWPSLFYITGGPALTQLEVNNHFSDNASLSGLGGNSTSQDKIGWTAGTGIEFAAFRHTSIYLEYLYTKIPSVKTTSSIANTEGGFGIPVGSLISPFSTTGEFHANLIKIGLNYRFDEK